jgi:hypothetical protein
MKLGNISNFKESLLCLDKQERTRLINYSITRALICITFKRKYRGVLYLRIIISEGQIVSSHSSIHWWYHIYVSCQVADVLPQVFAVRCKFRDIIDVIDSISPRNRDNSINIFYCLRKPHSNRMQTARTEV